MTEVIFLITDGWVYLGLQWVRRNGMKVSFALYFVV